MKKMIGIFVVVLVIGIVIAAIAWRSHQANHGSAQSRQIAEMRVPHSGNVLLVSIGVETLGGLFDPIFEAGATLPQTKEQIYTTATDNQQTIDIRILQGFSPLAIHNGVLAMTPDVNSGHEIFFMLRPALHRTDAHRQPGIGTPAVLAVFGDCRIPRCVP